MRVGWMGEIMVLVKRRLPWDEKVGGVDMILRGTRRVVFRT